MIYLQLKFVLEYVNKDIWNKLVISNIKLLNNNFSYEIDSENDIYDYNSIEIEDKSDFCFIVKNYKKKFYKTIYKLNG